MKIAVEIFANDDNATNEKVNQDHLTFIVDRTMVFCVQCVGRASRSRICFKNYFSDCHGPP